MKLDRPRYKREKRGFKNYGAKLNIDRVVFFAGRSEFLRALMPSLGKNVYVAAGAVVVGEVSVGDYSSIWFNAVLRGDINRIEIGQYSNVQDNAVVHVAENLPCEIGSYVTIGHAAIVHACTIQAKCLIGMGAIVLDGAVIGEECLVGAGTLITQGTEIPPGSLVLGAPGRVVRALSAVERQKLRISAENYVRNAARFLELSDTGPTRF